MQLDRLHKSDVKQELFIDVRLEVSSSGGRERMLPCMVVALVETLRLRLVYAAQQIDLILED